MRFVTRLLVLAGSILIGTSWGQTVREPSVILSEAGENLILEFEVGGESQYNRHPYPEWPRGDSALTWGVGWDAASYSSDTLKSDWSMLDPQSIARLLRVQPYRGTDARDHLYLVSDILIKWDYAIEVFRNEDIARTYVGCTKVFPGFLDLSLNCQAVLVSVCFNRGFSTVGPSRREFRVIQTLTSKKDYRGISEQILSMKRLWIGTDIEAGMTARRNAEAALVLVP